MEPPGPKEVLVGRAADWLPRAMEEVAGDLRGRRDRHLPHRLLRVLPLQRRVWRRWRRQRRRRRRVLDRRAPGGRERGVGPRQAPFPTAIAATRAARLPRTANEPQLRGRTSTTSWLTRTSNTGRRSVAGPRSTRPSVRKNVLPCRGQATVLSDPATLTTPRSSGAP